MKFRTSRSRFQTKQPNTVRDIGKSKNLIGSPDKTANFYKFYKVTIIDF